MDAVTSLLRTNDAPSSSDTAQIQQFLSQDVDLLAGVERELSVLMQRQKALQASIRDYETVLAPIRILSADILQYIFLFTLPDDRNPAMSSKESPLLITQVCSTWRHAALTAPRLWSKLHIPLIHKAGGASRPQNYAGVLAALGMPHNPPPPQQPQQPQPEEEEEEEEGEGDEEDEPDDPSIPRHRSAQKINSVMSNRRQMVELWLTRAKMADLSISVVDATSFPFTMSTSFWKFEQKWTPHSLEIVNLLVQHASHLAVLDLGIPPRRAKPILGLPPSKVPRLRSLRFCHPEYHDPANLKTSRYAVLGSPNIISLRVTLPAPVVEGTAVQWDNLINLALTIDIGNWTQNPDLLPDFLSVCQNLVALSMVITPNSRTPRDPSAIRVDPDSVGSSNLIVLPRLTTLLWDDRRPGSEHDPLFRRLSLPSLHQLKWTFANYRYSDSDNGSGSDENLAFFDLLRWSGDSLRKLELKLTGRGLFRRLFRAAELAPQIERLHLEPRRGGYVLAELGVAPDNSVWDPLCLPFAGQDRARVSDSDGVDSPPQDAATPLFPKLVFMSCRCDITEFTPLSLQRFIQSRRQSDLALAEIGASKLQKVNFHYQSPITGGFESAPARLAREARHRQFLEELTTKFGVDVEGLQVDIEWPRLSSNERLFSPLYGLPEGRPDYMMDRDIAQGLGFFPLNSLDLQ